MVYTFGFIGIAVCAWIGILLIVFCLTVVSNWLAQKVITQYGGWKKVHEWAKYENAKKKATP